MNAKTNLRLNLALPINSRLTHRTRDNEEYFTQLEQTRQAILADCAKPLQAMREASLAMDAIGSQIRGKEFVGYTADKKKYGKVFTLGRDDSKDIASENVPTYAIARVIEKQKHGGEGSMVATWVS